MNIELIGRQAIDKIRSEWGIPKLGFIAGGSLANITWEIISGNKAVVNDIDVFVFDEHIDFVDKDKKDNLFNYEEKELEYYEDYSGMSYTSVTKDFYSIKSSENEGMFNIIKYKSNTTDPLLVLNSFDINCTKIGYSIEEDKIYYTKEFEDFLNTGKLKIVNIMTPCHTAIRLAKKSKELNVKLSKFEFKLIEYTLSRKFLDILRIRFKQRYVDMYDKYKDILEPIFEIKRDLELELYVRSTYGTDSQLYYIESRYREEIIETSNDPFDDFGSLSKVSVRRVIFDDDNLDSIYRSSDFLFYMRNIYNNSELKKHWMNLSYFWGDSNYLDKEVTESDIKLLSRLARYAPSSINNLKGMRFSEQIDLSNRLFDKFKEDPIIAISILEDIKLDKDIILDEQTLLILELLVRKKIVSDTKGKVKSILGDEYDITKLFI